MVTHRLSYFWNAFFLYRPTQRVGLSLFFSFLFFLLANSTCWPVMIFFFGQLNVLAYYTAARWISSAFRYSPSHMLGKYFLRCWPLTATGNLMPSNSSSMYAFPGKTWSTLYGPCQVGDHLPNLLSLVPNGNTASQTKSPTWKSLGLTFLLYARATLALFSFIFSSVPKP